MVHWTLQGVQHTPVVPSKFLKTLALLRRVIFVTGPSHKSSKQVRLDGGDEETEVDRTQLKKLPSSELAVLQ